MRTTGYWVIRTYEAGQVAEKIKYWIEGERPTRSARRMREEIQKREHNERSVVRALARLANANYDKGDVFLGLDYGEAALRKLLLRAERIEAERAVKRKTLEDAEREKRLCLRLAAGQELKNYIKRVKRACEKSGIELRYIAVTADMDGETGEEVRVHHHLLVNGDALEACRAKWTAGGVDYKPLSGQPDYTPIAEYLVRQVRNYEKDEKKYTPGRNLERPEAKDRIAPSGAELRVPRHCALLQRGEFRPGRPQYIRYLLPPERLRGGETGSAGTEPQGQPLWGDN